MKKLVKRVCRGLGYDVRKIAAVRYPFRRQIRIGDHRFDMWIADGWGAQWYPEQQWTAELGELTRMVPPGGRVLEMGTHQGYTFLLLARLVGRDGAVIGVEASAETALVAQSQIGLNNLGDRFVVVHAAGDAATGGSLRVSEGGHVQVITDRHEGVEVTTIAGDDLDRRYGPFDMIKIDVEGYEREVLAGCSEILARKPRIAFEVHTALLREQGGDPAELVDTIGLDGYETTMVVRPDWGRVQPFDRAVLHDGAHDVVNLFCIPK